LEFPLTLPFSPMGEREEVRGQNVRRKFLDSKCKNRKLKIGNLEMDR
jgi:hypothetical protein